MKLTKKSNGPVVVSPAARRRFTRSARGKEIRARILTSLSPVAVRRRAEAMWRELRDYALRSLIRAGSRV